MNRGQFQKGHKPPPRTEQQLAAARKSFGDSKTLSLRRMRQLKHEERLANELRKDGFEVFSPTVVCDRIAIRNGKVFFVEFKKPGQELRPGQQRVRDLEPDMSSCMSHLPVW